MPPRLRGLGLGSLLVASAILVAAEPPAVSPAELVKQLGDRDYRTREEASKKLWELGETARPALEAALKSPSQEVVTRAKKVLDKFDRGILPDTSPELLELIDKFIADSEGSRFETAQKLIAFGPKGVAVLSQQLRKGFGSPEERRGFFYGLQNHLRQTVPLLLLEGKETEAENLLRLNIYGPNLSAHLDYATFLGQRGKGKELVEQMTEARTLPGEVGKDAVPGLLCAYRVTNDRTKLKVLLSELTKENQNWSSLREGLLLDMDDWATLAEEIPERVNCLDGLKAFRLRMAGKEKQAAELLAEVKASDHVTLGGYAIEYGALALLLNGKTEDGIARLKATNSAPHVLTDLQAVRLEFKDAMDVITAGLAGAKRRPNDDDEHTDTQMANLYLAKKGRILAQLGQRDAAGQIFGKMAEQLTFGYGHSPALLQLIKAEVRSGFPDLAAELLGKAQGQYDSRTANPETYSGQDPYEILFDADAEAALFWWQALRETRPKESPSKRMVTIRKLLAGKLSAAEVKDLLTDAAKAKFEGPRGRDPSAGNALPPFRKAVGMAAAQRAAGDTAAAIATLTAYGNTLTKSKLPEFADSPLDPFNPDGLNRRHAPGSRQWVYGVDESFRWWLDLADLLRYQKKHKEAAATLLEGWRLAPNNGVLLFYSGKALLAAGEEKEGKRRMALAQKVSLGDANTRARFLEELLNRGEDHADIRVARDAARLTGWLSEGNNGNVWNQVARASSVLKDFAEAASANRRAIHYVLRTSGVTYVEGYAYVNVLVTVRAFEARQLLANGKHAEALAAAREALTQMPTHTDLVVGMVQGLEKAGKKADADALFQQTWDAFGKVIREHPDSAWARHSASWLASACRRETTAALAFSKKAVELEPESKSHRSGLAEAHFRKGEREQAIAVMTKLVTEDHRNHFFARQLERYKTAPVDAPLPDNDDD